MDTFIMELQWVATFISDYCDYHCAKIGYDKGMKQKF